MSKLERHFHAKCAAANTPFIRYSEDAGHNEGRLYLSKRELLALAAELNQFIEYYSEDFTEPRIDYKDI